MQDTIFALATPTGGAIAIIRISGGEALRVFRAVFTGEAAHRTLSHGRVFDAQGAVDDAMGVYFAAPQSYTGEDMAELHIHGGYAVARRALAALAAAGARQAEPGEFTRRAFLAGKLDLSKAEAVMDMITATAQSGAASALEQLTGRLSRAVHAAEQTLIDALSGVNAAIDYPEELDEDVFCALPDTLAAVKADIDRMIAEGATARVLREGARVTILGRPNAGKSSLFNAIIGEERAIVTAAEGTTRDILEASIAVSGLGIRLFDTAGLRETGDEAESIGVARAREAIATADLLLIALDAARPLSPEDIELLSAPGRKLAVVCKGDLSDGREALAAAARLGVEAVSVSALSGVGVRELLSRVAALVAPPAESPLATNVRHIAALREASSALAAALAAAEPDCVATDIRNALAALGAITGSHADAEVIDRIFARFCVGK